jgi:hypothetical protein
VIGILLAKDLLLYALENKQQTVADLMRPVSVVPESKRLNVLLTEFRTKRNHMAIVVDEYGMTAGLVTIEDVLEPYLLQQGFIMRTPRGRVVTAKAYLHFGLKAPPKEPVHDEVYQ